MREKRRAKWEMSGSKKTTHVHGRWRILVLPGWMEVRLLLHVPQGRSPVSPGTIPGERREGNSFLLNPCLPQPRFLPATVAGFCFPPLIELEGSNWEFIWFSMAARACRILKSKASEQKAPANKNVLLPLLLFSSFRLEEQHVYERNENVNTGFANIQPCFPTRLLPVRWSRAGEGVVVLSWCFTRPRCGGCLSKLQRLTSVYR